MGDEGGLMIKGLIFDFDGLLVDTEYMLFRVHRDWFNEHYNYEISEAFYSNFVGLSDIDLYKYISEIGRASCRERV